MTTIIGIDPGLKGAIASIWSDTEPPKIWDMPTYKVAKNKTVHDEACLADMLADEQAFEPNGLMHVFIERQQAMPQQGVSSTFKTGYGFGMIVGICSGMEIPYTIVAPHAWKKMMGVTGDKDESRKRATELFPDIRDRFVRKRDDGRAEALLIAEYGRRVLG